MKKDIDKHREEAFITCSEDCWCWEEEASWNEEEQRFE